MSRVLPILFNTDMVRAILDGRKTVTRRLVKASQYTGLGKIEPENKIKEKQSYYKEFWEMKNEQFIDFWYDSPYQPGDTIYVRETWQHLWELDGNKQIIEGAEKYYYAASDTLPFNTYVDSMGISHENIPWKPSIHMPKEAARIWLKVTDVRVERLQECEKGWCLEIEKEGVVTPQDPILYINDDKYHEALRAEFKKLWNSTIKKSDLDRYGWDANPWVWRIEFERCEKPE